MLFKVVTFTFMYSFYLRQLFNICNKNGAFVGLCFVTEAVAFLVVAILYHHKISTHVQYILSLSLSFVSFYLLNPQSLVPYFSYKQTAHTTHQRFLDPCKRKVAEKLLQFSDRGQQPQQFQVISFHNCDTGQINILADSEGPRVPSYIIITTDVSSPIITKLTCREPRESNHYLIDNVRQIFG